MATSFRRQISFQKNFWASYKASQKKNKQTWGLSKAFKSLTMSLYLSKAGQAEIIRSAQKDDQYITQIHSEVAELCRRYDNRLWIKYDKLLKIAVQVFYYSFHAIGGIQTIGEEYTGIIQIDSKYTSLPSRCVSF